MIARLVAFLVVVLPLFLSRRRTVLIVMSWNDGRGEQLNLFLSSKILTLKGGRLVVRHRN
jgi:short subunit fatty acids transporter